MEEAQETNGSSMRKSYEVGCRGSLHTGSWDSEGSATKNILETPEKASRWLWINPGWAGRVTVSDVKALTPRLHR